MLRWLTGCVVPLTSPLMGYMLTPMMGNAPDLTATPWAGDTGCFSQPDAFDKDRYLDWLDRKPRTTNLFATAPDVVADADATWELSRPFFPLIRELGFNAALVAQDGVEFMPLTWSSFDCIFIGGSTEWKESQAAHDFGLEAKRRGKWLHWGRVNTVRRLKRARLAHADSADGTYIKYAPDLLLPRMTRWVEAVNAQQVFLLATTGVDALRASGVRG